MNKAIILQCPVKPECIFAEKHVTVLGSEWIGCEKIVGECGWIQEHNKCLFSGGAL